MLQMTMKWCVCPICSVKIGRSARGRSTILGQLPETDFISSTFSFSASSPSAPLLPLSSPPSIPPPRPPFPLLSLSFPRRFGKHRSFRGERRSRGGGGQHQPVAADAGPRHHRPRRQDSPRPLQVGSEHAATDVVCRS